MVCVGHLRLPSAVLQTSRLPAVLEAEAALASGLCSVSFRGQRLLTTGIVATRVGTPSHLSRPAHMQACTIQQSTAARAASGAIAHDQHQHNMLEVPYRRLLGGKLLLEPPANGSGLASGCT